MSELLHHSPHDGYWWERIWFQILHDRLTYALGLGAGLASWDYLLLNLVKVPLKVGAFAEKWAKTLGERPLWMI